MEARFTRPSGDYPISQNPNNQAFEAIVALNTRIHGQTAGQLCRTLDAHRPGMERRDWYSVQHPDSGECLSTLCRIPALWTLRHRRKPASGTGSGTGELCVHLPAAELGLVATTESARGLGLSSRLIRRFETDARARGDLVAIIEGITWFYNRFGYEFAAPLMVKLQVEATDCQRLFSGGPLPWRLRRAQAQDLPFLQQAHEAASANLDIFAPRDEGLWSYLCGPAANSPETVVERWIIVDGEGGEAGYLGVQNDCFGPTLAIAEASLPNRAAGLSCLHLLMLAEGLRQSRGLPHISILLPESHPLRIAAQAITGLKGSAYGWQVSVLNPSGMVDALLPVLEARVEESDWASKPWRLELNLYRQSIGLAWDGASLRRFEPGAKQEASLKADLPPELFSPLVLGYRSVGELGHCRLDLSASETAADLLDSLFPKQRAFFYPAF